jgi:wyosine [tRNA(Phe)-imidazoG37] synthetase (radical SAM superfamily)
MSTTIQAPAAVARQPAAEPASGTAFGQPRDFAGNRFVYTVISPRARGLSVGVNLNPDRRCNFDCIYCEVNRLTPEPSVAFDVATMAAELERTLTLVHSGGLRARAGYRDLPAELLELRHVALSGDGEPTLCPQFAEVVEAVLHLRARGRFPFFKVVLITNATGLNNPAVVEGLSLLTPRDEIWTKLDAGTQDYMNAVNRPDCTMEFVLENILRLGRQRPVVIQSLFCSINSVPPSASEVEAYAGRLRTLKEQGAQISLVQIYSATRPTAHSECGHLPLRTLSEIARRVRELSGLNAEVF